MSSIDLSTISSWHLNMRTLSRSQSKNESGNFIKEVELEAYVSVLQNKQAFFLKNLYMKCHVKLIMCRE